MRQQLLEQGGAPQRAGEGEVSLGGLVHVVDELVSPEPTQLALHLTRQTWVTVTCMCNASKLNRKLKFSGLFREIRGVSLKRYPEKRETPIGLIARRQTLRESWAP